jgi:hypothetical protein
VLSLPQRRIQRSFRERFLNFLLVSKFRTSNIGCFTMVVTWLTITGLFWLINSNYKVFSNVLTHNYTF